MNFGPLIFLGVFFTMACSWFGMIVVPQLQIGGQQPVKLEPTGQMYPLPRAGSAQQGAAVYRANGCAYCHSQQVRQEQPVFDVKISDLGTNAALVAEVARKIHHSVGAVMPGKTVWRTFSKKEADAAAKSLVGAGAKASVVIVPTGADIERGWGARVSVAQDYLYDQPILLGSRRIGPDITNIGARKPSAEWQLWHLYNPRLVSTDSFMPGYRFLFREVMRRKDAPPTLGALDKALVAKTFSEPTGEFITDIVPAPEAVALAAYLASLNPDAPLFEAPAPVPSAAPATNAAPVVTP